MANRTVLDIPLADLESTAIAAVMIAADILTHGFYSAPEIKIKTGKYDLVTPFDPMAEMAIIKRIKEEFPDHAFCGEESGITGDITKQITWVIDPIDGTLNFSRQIPSFATAIGAIYQGVAYLGVCYDPLARELFVARKGHGAYMNGKRLHVSTPSKLEDSGISIGGTVGIEKIHEIGFIRRTGSSVLDLCYVAKGALEGYADKNLNAWDYTAPKLIIEEAGGKVTTAEGKPIIIDLQKKTSLVASNEKLHGNLLQWISTEKK